MKRPIITFLLILIHFGLIGQSHKYEPIDKLGWEMTNFSIPDKLTEMDTGNVNYLLTINDKGKVKNVEVLSNTFDLKMEKLWRRMIKKLEFTRTDDNASLKKKYKGTLLITREPCNKPVENAPQSSRRPHQNWLMGCASHTTLRTGLVQGGSCK